MCNLFLCGVVDHVTWCFVVKVFVNKSANFCFSLCFSLSLSLLFVLIPVLSSLIMNYMYMYSAWWSTVQHVCGSCDHVAKRCTHKMYIYTVSETEIETQYLSCNLSSTSVFSTVYNVFVNNQSLIFIIYIAWWPKHTCFIKGKSQGLSLWQCIVVYTCLTFICLYPRCFLLLMALIIICVTVLLVHCIATWQW